MSRTKGKPIFARPEQKCTLQKHLDPSHYDARNWIELDSSLCTLWLPSVCLSVPCNTTKLFSPSSPALPPCSCHSGQESPRVHPTVEKGAMVPEDYLRSFMASLEVCTKVPNTIHDSFILCGEDWVSFPRCPLNLSLHNNLLSSLSTHFPGASARMWNLLIPHHLPFIPCFFLTFAELAISSSHALSLENHISHFHKFSLKSSAK